MITHFFCTTHLEQLSVFVFKHLTSTEVNSFGTRVSTDLILHDEKDHGTILSLMDLNNALANHPLIMSVYKQEQIDFL